MPKYPIISMPSWSPETRFSLDTALELTNWFRDNGHHPMTLHGRFTLRPGFTRAIEQVRQLEAPPHLLVYFGHGLPRSLLGIKPLGEMFENLRPVVAGGPCDNAGILQDFITVAIACDSLSVLGPAAVERGAVAYFSNETPLYILGSDLDQNSVPDFTDLYNLIPMLLGGGYTTGEAFREFRRKAMDLQMLARPGSYEQGVLEGVLRNFGVLGQDSRWV